MQAMILAAGFGSRLLPHSLIRPKPLFPVLNIPLLHLVVQRLKNLGFDKIVVNCHHLGEQIQGALQDDKQVTVLKEDVILGTGGGLRGALPHFRDEPLLITNGDIYHSVDLLNLYTTHNTRARKVTLATITSERFNSVHVRDNRVIRFEQKTGSAKVAFTGIHVIQPEILEQIPENQYSCIIDHYRTLLNQGVVIHSHNVDGCYWTDMGTPEDYLKLHEGLLDDSIPRWPELGDISGPFRIGKSSKIHRTAQFHGWVSIADAYIGENVHLENSVVWDNVSVPGGSRITNSILSSNAPVDKCDKREKNEGFNEKQL